MRLLGDLAAVVGVVDDEVGVAAQRDRAFTRKEAEKLGRLRAAGIDHRMQIDAAALYTVGIDQVDPVFDAGNAVWDFGEVPAAHFLLTFEIEWGVVGGDRADGPRGDGVPDRVLMALGAQWRGHNKLRAFEVRLLGVRFIKHKVRSDGFDPDVDAAGAGGGRAPDGIAIAGVDDVDVCASHFSKRHQMMDSFGLNANWPRWLVPFRSGLPFSDKPFLYLAHEFCVFAVGRDDDAEFFGEAEGVVELGVVDAESTLVGEEDFEGSNAALHDLAELLFHGGVESRDGHVKTEVASRNALGLGEPEVQTVDRFFQAARTAHFDERGGAADESGPAAGVVIVFGKCAHEGQVNVDVGIDEAGEDVLSAGVDHFGAGWRGQVATDGRDRFTFAEDVRDVLIRSGRDLAVLDEE